MLVFLVLAAAGAAAVIFLLGGGEASAARADVAAVGQEVAAQYGTGGDPVVMYQGGSYVVGTILIEATVVDPNLDFYPGAGTFCVVLTTAAGTSYSYSAEGGAVDGSCAPAGVEPFHPSVSSTLDASLTTSPYWFGLSVGDCLQDDTSVMTNPGTASPGPLSTPTVVPCTEPHVGEVYMIARIEGDEAPNDQAFRLHTIELCEGEPFVAYVGESYSSSDLFYSVLYPTEATFSPVTNEMVCILTTGGSSTGSLKGSAAESPAPSG